MQKITPFLWFDNQAEEAVKFYTAIFKNSKVEKLPAMANRQKRPLDDRRDRS
jgi:predicted 3-demethylubiquinone-9 3-methyltransferase (glyoxalase superfamily)